MCKVNIKFLEINENKEVCASMSSEYILKMMNTIPSVKRELSSSKWGRDLLKYLMTDEFNDKQLVLCICKKVLIDFKYGNFSQVINPSEDFKNYLFSMGYNKLSLSDIGCLCGILSSDTVIEQSTRGYLELIETFESLLAELHS